MSKLAKSLTLGAVSLIATAGLGFGVASLKASARLSQAFEAHAINIPVPYPLTEAELEELRVEQRAVAPEEAAQASDPLAGIDLRELAKKRAIERGKHLVEARYSCNVCHGSNLAGGIMIDDGAIGTLRGPNITQGKGSRVTDYTTSDWDRIVRHGIKPDGSPAVMPSDDFFKMTDHELSDIIAYIASVPAVDAEVPQPSFGPVGKILLALGKFPVSAEVLHDHSAPHVEAPPSASDSPEFGAHLAAICTGCHRSNLAGGPMAFGPPDWPAASNLTQHESGLKGWSYEEFERTLTEGKNKHGHVLREPMTVMLATAQAMTNTERKALWTYLTSLPPTQTNP